MGVVTIKRTVKSKRSVGRKIKYICISFVTVVFLILFLLYGTMWILAKGPSPTASKLFIFSVRETSAMGFLANLYMSDEQIDALYADATQQQDQSVDASLIEIEKDNDDSKENDSDDAQNEDQSTNDSSEADISDDGIEIHDVSSSLYSGKMMIVKDPKRVFVGVLDEYGEDCVGMTVEDMITKYDCVAGVNAGGYIDYNGGGTGGLPDGPVIYNGELVWGGMDESCSIAGIDENGILYVGNMTPRTALAKGVRYAACWGPALVMNGKSCTAGIGSGVNPRTAIGQRADGAILLLVINGRKIGSLGATIQDLSNIMLSYGAVNATNLDGGSSSIMIYEGEYLTESAYVFGIRKVATAFLVRRK